MHKNTPTGNSTYKPARVYDCEHHSFTEDFYTYLKGRTEYPLYNKAGIMYGDNNLLQISCASILSEGHSVAEDLSDFGNLRLSYMDRAGVTTAVISAGPGIEQLPKEDAVRFARLANDRMAEAVKKCPGRFLGTISLPTPYVEESIAELERAVNELGLQYWQTHSNYGNEYLYEEKFEPILAKCAELDVPFYLHPNYPSCEYLTETGIAMSSAAFGFGVDTMRTSMRLILNGVFDRYPNLQMILGHMGEDYPYTIDRIDDRIDVLVDFDSTLKCKHHVSYYFENKNIFMTTSGIYDPAVVTCAIETIGIDNVLFGTDYPFEDFKGEVDFVRSLPISDEDKDKIFYKNAEKYIIKKRS
ncbi:MAG TPA: amidohydrolase family protein [Methanocorpusculum sp.]|nr:amidohydrolase family protein [Methanocorpusculum sp.]